MRLFPRFSGAAAALAAAIFVINTAPVWAQASRTFVSGHGTDSGACGVTAPCRSFAYAISQTASGGEITVLDSAGYGSVTIAQAVTITNPGGVEAGVTAASGETAITIDGATALNVTLRGLTLEGGGVGANGIGVTSAMTPGTTLSLNILGCVVKDFTGSGIAIAPTDDGAEAFFYPTIADTFLLGNTGSGLQITANNSIFFSGGAIYRSVFDRNGTGINLSASGSGQGYLSVIDSHLDSNSRAASVSSLWFLEMIGSTAQNDGFGTDIANSGIVELYQGNVIGNLNNASGATAFTDGTNNIANLTGTALTKRSLQ